MSVQMFSLVFLLHVLPVAKNKRKSGLLTVDLLKRGKWMQWFINLEKIQKLRCLWHNFIWSQNA